MYCYCVAIWSGGNSMQIHVMKLLLYSGVTDSYHLSKSQPSSHLQFLVMTCKTFWNVTQRSNAVTNYTNAANFD